MSIAIIANYILLQNQGNNYCLKVNLILTFGFLFATMDINSYIASYLVLISEHCSLFQTTIIPLYQFHYLAIYLPECHKVQLLHSEESL